jgi:hypothetical protein
MRRLFGGSKKKEEVQIPSLSETSEGVSYIQMDKRSDVIK